MCPYVHSENRTGIFTLLGEDAVWSVQVKNCIIHLCTNINIRDVFWLNVTSRKHYFFTKKLFLSHVKPRATSTESASQCSVPKEIRAYHNEVVVDNLDYSASGSVSRNSWFTVRRYLRPSLPLLQGHRLPRRHRLGRLFG